jgi:membrane-bound serine protease (ClpP class)
LLFVALILFVVPIYSSFTQQNYTPAIVISSSASTGSTKQVYVIQLYEEIDQGSAAMITRGINDANSANATAVIIDMNTPGGILEDMLTMIGAINSSKVPVYTFVGNSSSAASAGSYVAMDTDEIFMSNTSIIGPSTPYIIGGTTLEEDHVANYTLSLMEDYAQVHGRNVTAAAAMAADNVAYYGVQAIEYHLANYSGSLSSTLSDLGLSGAGITTISENPSEQVLTFLSGNSTLDGILLILGIVAIAIDFFHPTIILSISGVVLIILALIGEEAIEGPSNYQGLLVPILLFIVAATLIILEIKTGHGFMLFAGVVVGAIGTYLFAYQVEYVGATPTGTFEDLEIGLLIFAGGLLALYARYIGNTIRKKPVTGEESLIGAKGIVYSDAITLGSDGEITVNGVVWRARLANSGTGALKKGDSVVVTKVEGLTLFIDRQVVASSPQEWKKVS